MKAFGACGFTAEYVRKRLPGAQGWVYYYWALENEASVFGTGLERKSDGYVKQEMKRRLAKKEKRDG